MINFSELDILSGSVFFIYGRCVCVWLMRLVDADADHSAQEYMAYCRVALACHPERSEGSPTRQCAVNAVISGGLSAIFPRITLIFGKFRLFSYLYTLNIFIEL